MEASIGATLSACMLQAIDIISKKALGANRAFFEI